MTQNGAKNPKELYSFSIQTLAHPA